MASPDLEAIEKRWQAATPGPWEWVEGEGSSDLGKFVTTDTTILEELKERFKEFPWHIASYSEICNFGNAEQYYPTAGAEPEEPNREFLAHSWQDIKDLLEDIKRLQETNSRMSDALNQIPDMLNDPSTHYIQDVFDLIGNLDY